MDAHRDKINLKLVNRAVIKEGTNLFILFLIHYPEIVLRISLSVVTKSLLLSINREN